MSQFPLSAHEHIASDAYWNGPIVRDRGIATADTPKQTNAEANVGEPDLKLYDWDLGKEIAALVLAFEMRGGRAQIPDGEPIPIPEANSRTVIKVVEDRRYIYRRRSLITLFKRQAIGRLFGPDDLEKFDETADEMVNLRAYKGNHIHAFVPVNSTRIALIQRSVMYLRCDKSGREFRGLHSGGVKNTDRKTDMSVAVPVTAMNVGTIFTVYDSTKRLQRIAHAEILEPYDVVEPTHEGCDPIRRRRRWAP